MRRYSDDRRLHLVLAPDADHHTARWRRCCCRCWWCLRHHHLAEAPLPRPSPVVQRGADVVGEAADVDCREGEEREQVDAVGEVGPVQSEPPVIGSCTKVGQSVSPHVSLADLMGVGEAGNGLPASKSEEHWLAGGGWWLDPTRHLWSSELSA